MADENAFGFCMEYDTVDFFTLLRVDAELCAPFGAVAFGGMPECLLFFPDSDCVAAACCSKNNCSGVVFAEYCGICKVAVVEGERCVWWWLRSGS